MFPLKEHYTNPFYNMNTPGNFEEAFTAGVEHGRRFKGRIHWDLSLLQLLRLTGFRGTGMVQNNPKAVYDMSLSPKAFKYESLEP